MGLHAMSLSGPHKRGGERCRQRRRPLSSISGISSPAQISPQGSTPARFLTLAFTFPRANLSQPPSLRSGWDRGARSFPMNSRRDFRSHRAALFDGIEEGGLRASAYSTHEIHEHENDRAMDSLHDRVSILKRLTGDIHEEVEHHNRMLDRMGNNMDVSRGFLSGTVDKFKMVLETKSSRRMAAMVASLVAVFLFVYYLLTR